MGSSTPASSSEAMSWESGPGSGGRERLIVGVDFGTTFSGVAAAHASAPDDIEIIKTWPGGSSDKVPSEISYEMAGDGAGQASIRWGFQAKADSSRIRCIKLFLDRTLRLPFYVDNYGTAALLQRCNKQVVDVVSDYLTQLQKHTGAILARRYGEAFMASAQIDYVLTCPAVWSDAAKNTTLLAAERAGMGRHSEIQMISEPEAAAVYTLNAIQANCLKVGDNIIVCDAGGGTVDLISYKILSLRPLRVEESAVGTGGLCGSAFLNYGFEAQVRRKLGAELLHEMKTSRRGDSWQTALNYFENVKRSFSDDYEQEWLVPFPRLPADEECGRDAGCLSLTASDMQAIFDPVVKGVCDLVEGQVCKMRRGGGVVSAIVLVGGFGQSDYLYRRLKDHFGSAAPPPYSERAEWATSLDEGPIEVLQPIYAWTAVVRGAVLRGLQQGSMVVSRRARMHYGTSYATTYDEAVHPAGQQYWSQLWERWMIGDRMQWLVAKVSAPSAIC
ncbi:hypothetical protein CDD82_1983 [Ophiocordyceps australis]|uniref:Actin-like ATPase domain-containing protein n=1 Tax=Ophiocordyceps australis TaxID=1399860 RepID=A0A2C5XZK9_9HYPO|nr:hypothetical protein CDD82_1983 [Ophiocordyceps australis]